MTQHVGSRLPFHISRLKVYFAVKTTMLQAKPFGPQAQAIGIKPRHWFQPHAAAPRLHRARATAKEEKKGAESPEQSTSQQESDQTTSTVRLEVGAQPSKGGTRTHSCRVEHLEVSVDKALCTA